MSIFQVIISPLSYSPHMTHKLGCVVTIVVDSILPHAESGPTDHQKDAPRLCMSQLNRYVMC